MRAVVRRHLVTQASAWPLETEGAKLILDEPQRHGVSFLVMEMVFVFALLKHALRFYNPTCSTLETSKTSYMNFFCRAKAERKGNTRSVAQHVLCILSLQFYISPGREGTIVFDTGPEEQIYKDKNGQLTVVSGCVWGGREALLDEKKV